MNVHSTYEQPKRTSSHLPSSFARTARQLNLQGWEQGHAELIISRNGLVELLQTLLHAVEVDEDWYLETYSDVRRAIDDGSCPDAVTHYRTFGYFEGRLPALIAFNPLRYLEKNPDLAQPLGDKGTDAILEHFIRHGYQEGRQY